MSEKQEKVWIVVRRVRAHESRMCRPVKAFDDRVDARTYAKRLNRSKVFEYSVQGVLKG